MISFCDLVVLLIGIIASFRLLTFLFGSNIPETQNTQHLEITLLFIAALIVAGLLKWAGI